MRIAIILLISTLLATACAGSQPFGTNTPLSTALPPQEIIATASPDAASPLMDTFQQVLHRVSAIRVLEPLNPIPPKFMTRLELEAVLNDDLEESKEDIVKSQKLLKLLGLIPQDADLHAMLLSLYTEQVVGFYDTETEELYVITGKAEMTPLDEVTLAHEYVHALQQQHFDIGAMSKAVENDSEAYSALSALIEGDAVIVQSEYALTYLTLSQRQAMLIEASNSPVFDASPYFLQRTLQFPYNEGANMVNYLLVAGGWEAIEDAYRNPPTSTEHVLHPQKYLAGEAPINVSLPETTSNLGTSWQVAYDDVLGEFFLRTYLETHVRASEASRAAAGWGGDRFNLLEGPQGELCLVVLLVWDSERDAQEFFNLLDIANLVPEPGFLFIKGNEVVWILSESKSATDAIKSVFPYF